MTPTSSTLPPGVPAASDEQHAVRVAARAAEDAGDLLGARRLLALLSDDETTSAWRASLEVGLRCREDRERALWLLQPAFRHGFTAARRDALLALAADVLRTRGVAAVAGSAEALRCAGSDPLIVDAGLFECGMLADYLACVLLPAAHPLSPLLQSWVAQPTGVWEVGTVADGRVELRDLTGGEPVALGASSGAISGPGDLLYGRVVPLGPLARFATAPVPIDRLTARRVLRALARGAPLGERLRAVASHQRRSRGTGTP